MSLKRHRWRRHPSNSTTHPASRNAHPDSASRAFAVAMKLAVVVQRYGEEINGGAELHARYIAEHLARHADVRVLTTCARDYITWRNEFPAGEELVNGIRVERFPVARERQAYDFARRS